MKRIFYKKIWFKVIAGSILILGLILTLFYFSVPAPKETVWGINYSPEYMKYLGFDPTQAFSEILTELKPKKVRLAAYWENIETRPGQYDFTNTDALLKIAQENGAKVILILGHKQPRWPECHHPSWYENLSSEEKNQAVLNWVKAAAAHFKDFSIIERWQIENEPFFDYGKNCPVSSPQQVAQEIKTARELDTRPVILTDSGEKGGWFQAAELSDIFGSTMYRTVYNPKYGGYITYPLPPAFYRMRAGMLKVFLRNKLTIGVELQAEPWFSRDINDTPLKEQFVLMNPEIFQANVNYAKSAGFAENYFWGAEWWYWLKNSKKEPEMWEAAKRILE